MDLIGNTPFPDIFEKDDICRSEKCLLQGDIIKFDDEPKLSKKQYDSIGYLVVSNSCDLENDNVRVILLAPIYPIDVWFKENSKNKNGTNKRFSDLAKDLHKEANYGGKGTFFISPGKLGPDPAIAHIDDIKPIKPGVRVFSWNEVPGLGKRDFIENLRLLFKINWLKGAIIEKLEGDNIIQAFVDNNTLFLIRDSSDDNVTLVINDGRIIKFKLRTNGEKQDVIFSFYEFLLKHRLCCIKSPWREQLGFKVGNLFNRVSTYTPAKDNTTSWTRTYNERDSNSSTPSTGV